MTEVIYRRNPDGPIDDDTDLALLFITRDGDRGDYDFIYNAWIRSYRVADAVKLADSSCYYKGHNEMIGRILRTADIRVLASAEDPETIVACMISSNQWIHYIYTKHSFRKMGLARRLVGDPKKFKGYSQATPCVKKIKLPEAWVYNPYRAWLAI